MKIFSGNSKDNFLLLKMLQQESLGFGELKKHFKFDCSYYPSTKKLVEKIDLLQGVEHGFNDICSVLLDCTLKTESVSFLPLDRMLNVEEKGDILKAFEEILESGRFTSGPKTEVLEKEIARLTEKKHVLLCSSGTDAMLIAFLAMGIKPGDEIIMPPNSFAATENAVLASGAKPVLVDISVDDHLLDVEKLESLITSRTKCILPVHLYGKVANMKEVQSIAQKHSLLIVEDACQSIGSADTGKYSDAAILSFNPYKNFGVCGKAGGIVTDDEKIIEKCREIAYHGFVVGKKNVKTENYGFNSNIDNTQAAIALAKLPHFALNNFKRLLLAYRYCDALKRLQNEGKIIIPGFTDDNVWHHYPIQILNKDRDKVMSELKQTFDIETDIYYPVLTHQYDIPLQQSFFGGESLPNAELVNSRLLNLPIYPTLSIYEQNLVIEAIYEVTK